VQPENKGKLRMKKLEILPRYFFTVPFDYCLVQLRDADPPQANARFAYALNSQLASKRAGRLVSFAVGHGAQVTDWRKISIAQLLASIRDERPDIADVFLPRNGLLRLADNEITQAFWAEVMAGLHDKQPIT